VSEQWTPGPWTADKGYELVDCDGDQGTYEERWFVFADDAAELPPIPKTEADARLIAAAPEMAELLAREHDGREVDGSHEKHRATCTACALLSRIRGES
jgi:hypothetical protein